MLQTLTDISNSVGYNVLVCSNDDIIPGEELKDDDAQKIVIFDDFICEKNQKPLIDYFIRGRHKNCSVIYLSNRSTKHQKIFDSIALISVSMTFLAAMKEV